MGGGGFIQSMKNVYDHNRSLIASKKSMRGRSKEDSSHPESEPLRFNKMSIEEYAVFKSDLRRKTKRRKIKNFLAYFFALLLIVVGVFCLALI